MPITTPTQHVLALARQVWIALPQGSHAPTLDYPPVKMVQFSGDAFAQGVDVIRVDQVPLRVSWPKPWRTASNTATRLAWTWRWRR